MKTYDYLPYRLSDVLRLETAKVSDNLASESTLSIPAVYFYAETWTELCDRLAAEGESDLSKNTRFPFIALIGNDEYDINDKEPFPEVSCTVIVVTKSDPTWRSEKRIQLNYNPILYPIYTEFLEMVSASVYFQGPFNPYPSHKCIENYNLSQQGATGGTVYKLNDNVDGLILTNLKLRLNRPRIAAFNYGPTKSLTYLNNVSEINIAPEGNKLAVTLNRAQYINADEGHPNYLVFFSHGETSSIEISVAGTRQSNSVAIDGEYYGYVQCDDGTTISRLFFHYACYSGVISKCTTYVRFHLESFLATSIMYPDVQFNIVSEISSSKSNLMQREFTTNGGNVLYSENYTPAISATTELIYPVSMPATNIMHDVGFNLLVDGPSNTSTLLESISYFKIQ